MKKNKQFFLGLDISKPFFDAALLIVTATSKQEIATQQFANDKAGIGLFEKWLKTQESIIVWSGNSAVAGSYLFILVMQRISNGASVLPAAKVIR